ncbi:hypothetical protein C2I18_03520 [Paenibacillus sp. PK3_47]|nr:hypothetical protein C2I18_03520 [Paenibacillus sp. PK3_47]
MVQLSKCNIDASVKHEGVFSDCRFKCFSVFRNCCRPCLAVPADLGVQEIAKLCGFYEESHFSEIFKQLNGVSPSAYRSRQRSGDYGLFLCDSR